MAFLLSAIRRVVKTTAIGALAHISGMSWRKGMLTGFALAPISVFAILTIEHARYISASLVDHLAPFAAMALLLDIFGPIMTQRALIWAQETPDSEEN
jgi:Kef-type K+ transport system membrane component KefB